MKHASLCIGIGGLDLAVEATFGSELAWYSEIEPAACQIIDRNWDAPNIGDLTTFDWADAEPVDILTAGYPCQPFSQAGKRKGKNDARHLWPYIDQAVRTLRPSYVVLENVRGHLTLGFDAVLGSLAEAGFDAEWCLLRASDVGAPHQRARIFIVATDADAPGPQGAQPTERRDLSPWGGGAPADAERSGLHPRGRLLPGDEAGERGRRSGDEGGEAPAHPDGDGLGRGEEPHLGAAAGIEAPRRGDADGLGVAPAWGDFAPAITRWELVLGRPAPWPVDDVNRLSPPFVEWMMGYPEGWVDGLSRPQALKALGNAVVPQQGAAALRILTGAA